MPRNAAAQPSNGRKTVPRKPAGKKNADAAETPPSWLPGPPLNEMPSAEPVVDGLKRVAGFNLEMSRFLARRARKNAGALASFARCSSPLEAMDIWREAALEAIDDYTEEASKLLDPPKH